MSPDDFFEARRMEHQIEQAGFHATQSDGCVRITAGEGATMADNEVRIEYGARPFRGAWRPYITENGRDMGGAWGTFSREDALRIAEADARERAARYLGDWVVSVRRASE